MQFKHPEILYFLFLLVIPIVVHLFQLRRFKKSYFTNVRFLKELSIQTRKSSKLKKWLLLATRLLLMAAAIIAFAQPFFDAPDKKNANSEMFIILDNSFSMQAKGQRGELLKRAVEDLITSAPAESRFSLLTNSQTFWDTDIRSIRNDLQKIGYSAEPFSLEKQLSQIESRRTQGGKDLIVITDGIGVQKRAVSKADTTANTHFIIGESQQRSNISIDTAYIAQAPDTFYEVRLRLTAYGDTEQIPVALYNRGKLAAKTTAKFSEGKKEISFMVPKEDFHGHAQIDDNSLAYDNTLYFSISRPKKSDVISIGEVEKGRFLSRIFTPGEFNYSNFQLTSLDYSLIEKQDAVVINELVEIPASLQSTLKSFVAKGGNLVVIPSGEANAESLSQFLSQFGFSLGQKTQNTRQITRIAFGHPLFSGVFEKKIDNFQYPEIKSGFALSGGSAALAFEDGGAFLSSVRKSLSSVYVFSSPLEKSNGNFQNSPLIVPAFYNMAQNASKTGISSITIGQKSPLVIDADTSKDEILEVRGEEEKFIPLQQMLGGRAMLTFGENPKQAGNFSVYNKSKMLRDISFNYARTEGNLQSPDDAVFADAQVSESLEAIFSKIQSARTDNVLWQWFVVLALLLLITELLIQKFVK